MNGMSEKKSLFRRVCDALFVQKCVACRERKKGSFPLCADCHALYLREKEIECGICGKPLCRCICTNDYMKRHGIKRAVKLFYYFPDNEEHVSNLLLYRLKRNRNLSLFEFLASEFSDALADVLEGDEKETVITHVPRTGKQKRRYGFDQAGSLARALGKELSVPFVPLLGRLPRAKVQKQMQGVEERRANVKGTYFPKNANISLHNKRVLLLDDIVTTGASVVECARVLRRMGAEEIIVAALAVSLPRTNLAYELKQNTHLKGYF